ncbi:uncharacterized protein FIESC28_00219 [Fusarium coffeatum]|uniref:Uncharacterized protein n=1 Tax=Fusarium coffeatum TaxID=231269 RepID=A0A366SCA5_9HYPO|nr:uncharacterized protein FIESC28_00219 [Fusarium coffeatum]RBR26951.1 hypothetical protein FIESC28_00219 [Fusarium coffeatum]
MASTLGKEFLGALPTELCFQVLQSLESKTAISSLIRASSRMLQVYLRYKAVIVWHILASDFDKDMIQDAIFIIQLPRSAGPLYIEEEYEPWKAIVSQWIAKDLPDPVASRDKSSQLFWSLNKLHSVLIRLGEDYITKARSKYMIQSYPCLPQMRASQRHLTFKGKEVMTRMDAGQLQQSERRKLLKSFLFYEWTAKAMRTQHMFVLLNFDFDLLISKPREVSLSDEKGWASVQVYVATLYKAIFAQITEGRLPEPEKDFCPDTGIPHWHFASTSLAIYSAFSPYDVRVEGLPEELTAWGLDLLMVYLNLDVNRTDDRELVEDHFGAKITKEGEESAWSSAHLNVMMYFETDVLFTSGEMESAESWCAWEYLNDAKPHYNRNLVTRHCSQWSDDDLLRHYEERPHVSQFDIEVALHWNRMKRKRKSTKKGRSPLPQLIETRSGYHVIEQSPAFWRVGLRSL